MIDAVLEHFVEQGLWCDEFGSPFTGALMRAMADDIRAGGPVATLTAGWPGHPRADALSLRLAGALHYAALERRDEALAAAWPGACPDWSMDAAWPLARAFLGREQAWAAAFLRSPPQTNETRRAIALLAGFLAVAREHGPVMDILEIGASAGLNQNWDRFAYRTSSWSWGGPGAVTIETDWSGSALDIGAPVSVRSRAACDLNPLDLRDPAQRRQLRAYIWPDQTDRLKRFDAAADLAVANAVTVERADAGEWLERKLAARAGDAVTVVYHSVFYQYPTRETRERIAAAIRRAGEAVSAPLVWLRLEPEALFGGPQGSPVFLVDMVSFPGGTRRIIAETDGHVRAVRMR